MSNTFSEIVAENFSEISRNFHSGLVAKGYEYDEDIMSDAFIRCCTTLKDKQMTKQEALKYYWVAYINKYKTKVLKPHIIEMYEDMTEFDDIEDEKYNNTIDKIYNIIIKELQDKYGVRKACIWEMYACEGMTVKEIKKLGFDDIDNYAYFAKQIKRYIKNHIVKENQELKELIKYRNE